MKMLQEAYHLVVWPVFGQSIFIGQKNLVHSWSTLVWKRVLLECVGLSNKVITTTATKPLDDPVYFASSPVVNLGFGISFEIAHNIITLQPAIGSHTFYWMSSPLYVNRLAEIEMFRVIAGQWFDWMDEHRWVPISSQLTPIVYYSRL